MERRNFIKAAGTFAGVTALGGAFWGRAAVARANLTQQLVSEASPILVRREHSELASIPDVASEEMKLWFTAVCLNSSQFVEHICSSQFGSLLGNFSASRDKEMRVQNEFLARVVSPSAINRRIDLIAKESGAVLDRNWKECCDQIAELWQLRLDYKNTKFADKMQLKLDAQVSTALEDALSRAVHVADRPSALHSIGATAMTTSRFVWLGPQILVPVFAVVAITHFAKYVISVLNRRDDIHAARTAITDRLSHLGTRVADEFHTELKAQIADLHSWQNEALRNSAGEYARESIRVI